MFSYRPWHLLLAAWAITAAVLPETLAAQQELAIESGARVRFRTQDGQRTGVFNEITSDSLRLRIDDTETTMHLLDVYSLDVSKGVRSRQTSGLAIGALAGASIGAVVGLLTSGRTCGREVSVNFFSDRSNVATTCRYSTRGVGAGILIGGLVGGGTGSLIGGSIRRDDWRRIW